jgi:hypothetical protein
VPTISARKLVPGMRLIRPVLNKNGLVMIGENTELTENLIRKILDMDVDMVQVDGVAKELPPKEEALALLRNRFRKVETQPYMDVLKRLITEHIEGLYK